MYTRPQLSSLFGIFALSSFIIVPSFADGQKPTLTLDEALRLAKTRNGTVASAEISARAANYRVAQALAGYYPTIAPFYQYNSSRQNFFATGGSLATQVEGATTRVNSNWKILDSGERDFQVRQAKRSRESTQFNAKQTLRATLFTVVEQYFETLRAIELQKVTEEQVDRASLILRQTEARITVGDVAPKDRLQAQADFLNARVQVLGAKNRSSNTAANLKATIGISAEEELAKLEKPTPTVDNLSMLGLPALLREATRIRPDLQARQANIQAQWMTKRLNERQAGFTFSVDLQLAEQYSPTRSENRVLSFLVSYPLFDAGRLKAISRETSLNIEASKQDLIQAERQARAEIESSYRELLQNAERLEAAKKALEAAQINYDAAAESQRLGASTIVEVSLARVSLVTAQSESIQATYDYAISDARLRLVTGRAIPGE